MASQDLNEQRKAIYEAMEYAVPEGMEEVARDVVDIYRDDQLGLVMLREFYSYLPDPQGALVREIKSVGHRQGIFLLAALTGEEGYLYLVSSEGIEFHGSLKDGYLAVELLDFFEFEDLGSFKKLCASPDDLPVYEPIQINEDICPACHSSSGQFHELGCPVEICPWCGGQLIGCDCRYEQLGLEAITSEEELNHFEAKLEERGRIPFSREQRPSFADEGPGVVLD